jgi:ATP-dependent RNA helicase DBP3
MGEKRPATSLDAGPALVLGLEGSARKKSKKSQPVNDSRDVIDVNSLQNEIAYDTSSTSKKLKKKHEEETPGSDADADLAAQRKAERKAARHAKRAAKAMDKKEAKAARKAAKANLVALDKEDEKRAKTEIKAEKAKRKALNGEVAAKEQSSRSHRKDTSSGTVTPSEPVSSTSSVPSLAQSSATSPEPAESPAPSRRKYAEHPDLLALPQSQIDEYLSSNNIVISDEQGKTAQFRPIKSFGYLPTMDEKHMKPFAGFKAPTPIQAAAWPWLLAKRDVIGVAETGSGKTFAFGLPCVRYITSLPATERQRGAKAVIVSPTRELACQIHDQLVQIAQPAGLTVACIYGGVSKDPQYEALKTAAIIVATPGRLNDLIQEGAAKLGNVGYLVLDEADRMLDKGFEEEIRKIISMTPAAGRQTLMFTATWPQTVRDLAMTFMKNPVKITIGDNPSGELRANTRITQLVEVIEPRDKQYRLIQLLKQYQSGKNRDDRILVFCLYKKEATRIEEFIRSKGFRVAGIHGDLSQAKRTESLDAFKKGSVPVLVATDVAARGLDIPAVKVVINVTFPLTAEDYVHRIGRTGRAGQDGLAITLFTEHDKALSGS